MKFLFALLRLLRDMKAISRGRVSQRIWNRGVSRVARKLYK